MPRPDDFELYLLHLATEYATKDTAFLYEHISAYGETQTHTVLQGLLRAANFTMDTIGLGPHGLLRLLSSDWDDVRLARIMSSTCWPLLSSSVLST